MSYLHTKSKRVNLRRFRSYIATKPANLRTRHQCRVMHLQERPRTRIASSTSKGKETLRMILRTTQQTTRVLSAGRKCPWIVPTTKRSIRLNFPPHPAVHSPHRESTALSTRILRYSHIFLLTLEDTREVEFRQNRAHLPWGIYQGTKVCRGWRSL